MTKIIDCTLRDGGYLTNWSFDKQFVQTLYNTANDAGVEFLEIGYRNFAKSLINSPYSLCDEKFISEIFCEKQNTKLAVMVDVGKSDISLFNKNSIISLVRVAVYPDRLNEAFKFCEELKNLNYNIMLNLMTFGKYTNENINILKKWQNKNILESVCFADSFGAFFPNDIEKYCFLLKDIGFDNVSFHAHNNIQLAFANSIKAVENNCYSLDASVCGIGRSAGILPIELILGYKNFNDRYKLLPYLKFINKYMPDRKHIEQIIGGLKNIHPKYVSELSDKYGDDIESIWENAEFIALQKPVCYVK